MSASGGRFPLGVGAIGSLLLHAVLLVLVLVFVHGTVHLMPPKPKTLVTLELEPPPPPTPIPRPKTSPTMPLVPMPTVPPLHPQTLAPAKTLTPPTPAPRPITSQTMSSVPMPSVPPPPAQALAPARTLPPPPPVGPQPGVVGYRISDAYKKLLENKIQSNLRYPPMAARQGRQGTALVKVRMQRDGTIESVTLVKSAGTSSLDEEARAVFKRIGKLPALPKDFLPTASEFQFEIPITFRLVGGG